MIKQQIKKEEEAQCLFIQWCPSFAGVFLQFVSDVIANGLRDLLIHCDVGCLAFPQKTQKGRGRGQALESDYSLYSWANAVTCEKEGEGID